MDTIEPSSLQVVGGFLMIVGLFVLRELASGALKEAGKDLWIRAKGRGKKGCECLADQEGSPPGSVEENAG
jgi:hypothetical protein